MADLKLVPLHGLWTSPSAISAAPLGTMAVAQDIGFRKPGVLEPLTKPDLVVQQPFTGDYEARVMFRRNGTYDVLAVAQNTLSPANFETRAINLDTGIIDTLTLYGAEPRYNEGQVFRAFYRNRSYLNAYN